jgi:hypothetical protein
MYGVPDAISSLDQQQLVHAVVIADMVHAELAGQQAVQVLTAAAQSEQGLSAKALHALASLPAWPSCLLQLLAVIVKHARCCRDVNPAADAAAVAAADIGGRIQRLLLSALGNLESVWADEQLKKLLLQLPLQEMQLLLSADQLCVASEDTVLYMAEKLIAALRGPSKPAAKAALAQLVRAPQLSQFALSCAVLSSSSRQQLLGEFEVQLKNLLSLKLAGAAGKQLLTEASTICGAPSSWSL